MDKYYLVYGIQKHMMMNQILITYYNATDFKDPSTYVEWGMVMDFDVLNINREKGFMRYVRNNKTNHMDWKQFRIEPDGAITELTSGGLVLYGEVGVFVEVKYPFYLLDIIKILVPLY
uniref:Uncharacterized protein n=1 Tax=Rhizophagus irregularis (strain DAOM 181602 / DAOM 197198 / MUCL 43194) TaxID=747089 RepID=U9TT73_RHIID